MAPRRGRRSRSASQQLQTLSGGTLELCTERDPERPSVVLRAPRGRESVWEIAKQYGIPHTAALPIDRKLAASADKGMIELTNGDWLDEIANAIDELPAREHK